MGTTAPGISEAERVFIAIAIFSGAARHSCVHAAPTDTAEGTKNSGQASCPCIATLVANNLTSPTTTVDAINAATTNTTTGNISAADAAVSAAIAVAGGAATTSGGNHQQGSVHFGINYWKNYTTANSSSSTTTTTTTTSTSTSLTPAPTRLRRQLFSSQELPSNYGSGHCFAWDSAFCDLVHDGTTDASSRPDWCDKMWCFVDKTNCDATFAPVEFNAELTYSYLTCRTEVEDEHQNDSTTASAKKGSNSLFTNRQLILGIAAGVVGLCLLACLLYCCARCCIRKAGGAAPNRSNRTSTGVRNDGGQNPNANLQEEELKQNQNPLAANNVGGGRNTLLTSDHPETQLGGHELSLGQYNKVELPVRGALFNQNRAFTPSYGGQLAPAAGLFSHPQGRPNGGLQTPQGDGDHGPVAGGILVQMQQFGSSEFDTLPEHQQCVNEVQLQMVPPPQAYGIGGWRHNNAGARHQQQLLSQERHHANATLPGTTPGGRHNEPMIVVIERK
ncbi:unnamed protein product [Amoebophrya sp. A120]|nr:unnamed protein product [Amoebophrya sp. A120]|eukprot:GSA120T00020396001.1